MARAEAIEADAGGAWSRFARVFAARKSSRWGWRALLLCVGLAVFAPLIANDRPYFARVRDVASYREALSLFLPITESFIAQAHAVAASQAESQAGLESEERALEARIAALERALGGDRNSGERQALSDFWNSCRSLSQASRAHEVAHCLSLGLELSELAAHTREVVDIESSIDTRLEAQRSWPLFAALTPADLSWMILWAGLAGFRLWSRFVPRRPLLVLFAGTLALGICAQCLPHPGSELDASVWKARLAADARAVAVFPPISFGPAETQLDQATLAPSLAQRHWCGTDALGRDLLARLLYAGRTSFAVAGLASVLIVAIGSALGLLAGALRGATDMLVSRAIELLQSFPTLVLLLGLVALLPPGAANSRWTIPLVIAGIGWTHIARLARAEALRVNDMPFVRAATAAGFSRSRVLLRHVLANSMGPVWIAASFVLSAGLVLESSAAFLGFGVQHPAPSWGGLLAEARGGNAWWLALFPGLWMFAAILSIHLVGEGVRDALDPRLEAQSP